jgi:hypothetical protein
MKIICLLLFTLLGASSQAGNIDSLFQRHQFIISETDGFAHQFDNGPNGATTHDVVTTGNMFFPKVTDTRYLPNYALHIHFLYSLRLTKHIRLETGLGYMFEGYTLRATYVQTTEVYLIKGSYNGYQFIRSFTVPIHIKFMKPMGGGAFTCTFGPNFTMPIQSFTKENHIVQGGISEANTTIRERYNSASTFYQSSMGVDLKMGYQKQYYKQMALDIGPVVNFSNLALLDKNLQAADRASGYRPYQYYIGLDVAIVFSLKKESK